MILTHLKNYKIVFVIGAIISIVLAFINVKFATGLLLGIIFEFTYTSYMSYMLGNIIKTNNSSKFSASLFMILGILIICIPMALSFMFSEYIHYMGVFIGLILNKFTYVILNFRR